MIVEAWLRMGAGDLGRAVEAGRIDPVALAETFLDAIAAHPDAGRIYACPMPERARTEARAAAIRAGAGTRRHPLDGVPLSWKDVFDSAGAPTEGGSALLKGRLPDRDAVLLAAASGRGAVCLGKTHLSELAFSGLGLNPMTATPPNIHDPARVPGGSSSGAAASLAFGLAAGAIGTDTGGSTRIPAAWNDLVGMRTTPGRLPMTGILPLAPGFDTAGPLVRNVEDANLLLSLLDGTPPADLSGATLAGTRLLVLETIALDDLHPAPAAAFDSARRRLEAAGARISPLRLPEIAEALALAGTLVAAEAWAAWGPTITAAPDLMFPPIRARFESGATIAPAAVETAGARLADICDLWTGATADADAVILPTVQTLPPATARLLVDAGYYATENLAALRNTRLANLLGLPAITLPTGSPACGLMFFARPGDDRRLLHLAAAAEAVLG